MSHVPWSQLPGAALFAIFTYAAIRLAWWLRHAMGEYEPNCVYDIDDRHGQLLYVGHAKNPHERMKRHAREARTNPNHWWGDAHPDVVAALEPSRVTWYRSEPVAKARETERINKLQPPGNIVGTVHRGAAYRKTAVPPAADPEEE
jgi:hypothetical protein